MHACSVSASCGCRPCHAAPALLGTTMQALHRTDRRLHDCKSLARSAPSQSLPHEPVLRHALSCACTRMAMDDHPFPARMIRMHQALKSRSNGICLCARARPA